MTSNKLQDAREYEGNNIPLVPAWQRPVFHVTGGIGWINDPNGFSYYKGEYHLFYQYHPYSTNWGPMHWGHLKTRDFIKWDRLPIALAPDQDYDNFGCFSGSGIELDDGRHLLIYTCVRQSRKDNGSLVDFQQQAIAIGDGINYTKLDCNPVIGTDMIPRGNSLHDFRDPKIYKKDDLYYVVVGSRGVDNSGEIIRYKSRDLRHFDFDTILFRSNNEYGKMWECPDYFSLNSKMILMASPQEMVADGLEFTSGNNTVFVIGDEADGRLHKDNIHSCDYGTDFYAPQSLLAEDGRRIMIAWMQSWETSEFYHEGRKIYGSMTLPRELSLKNGRIYSNPVRELDFYHKDRLSTTSLNVLNKKVIIEGVYGRIFDMIVNIKSDFESFRINLAEDDTHNTSVVVNKNELTITMDRSNCGIDENIIAARTFTISPFDDLTLRIIMDRNSIELFVNDGEKSATMLTYTGLEAEGISFEAKGSAIVDIDFYTLNL